MNNKINEDKLDEGKGLAAVILAIGLVVGLQHCKEPKIQKAYVEHVPKDVRDGLGSIEEGAKITASSIYGIAKSKFGNNKLRAAQVLENSELHISGAKIVAVSFDEDTITVVYKYDKTKGVFELPRDITDKNLLSEFNPQSINESIVRKRRSAVKTHSLSESQLFSNDVTNSSDEELMLSLSEILWEFTNDRERWDHTSRLGYADEEGWNTVVRDKFGTKCFRLAFGNNGGSQTSENKWKDYLEDISDFVVEYEQKVREVFGPKANVWIINIVFDVVADVYDLVCGVSVGEEFDYFESDEMQEKLVPPEIIYGKNRKPPEKEIENYKKLLGPSYDESMNPFVEGWIH